MNSKEYWGLMEAYAEVYAPEQLDEISLKTKMSAFKKRATHDFESDSDSDNYTKSGENKTDKIKANIVKKHGKKAGEHAERAAHAGIFGRKSFSMPKKPTNEELDIFDVVLEFLQAEGYAETLEEAEWMMANLIDEEAIEIITELSVNKMLAYGKAAKKDRDVLNKKWDEKKASHKEKMRVLGHEEGEERSAQKIKKKTGKYPHQMNALDKARYAVTKEDYVNEAQAARENPEKYEREQSKKYAPVRGERTPMPPRGDKRREDFEKWYAANVR